MTLTTDKVHCGIDLTDLLLRNAEETTGCHSNQPWTITVHDTLSPEGSTADDFLDALLGGSDSSSATASPLWSPCTTDSGIIEDPPTDPAEGVHPPSRTAFPAFNSPSFPQLPSLENQTSPNEKTSYVSIDLGWESSDLQEQFGIAYYLTTNQTSPLSSSQTLTVKDLLLSNLGKTAQQIPQNSLQELVLNEDEKRLLAKEGVNLPSKLPLSKFEERVLKKIRRKIRNKHSAQESRKKKREYVDSLEGRMSACTANNLELQRKIQKLEETNNALLEQLSRLQALLPNSSSKTTHRGTCILVLLLSFTLLISSNLQPEPYSQLSQGEYTHAKVPSRSLLSVDEAQDAPPLPLLSVSRGFEDLCSLTEKL
ncbi:cyclic AMP-responsive element-binding protein 3-like protein 3-A [Symphorus nematophorus]